MGNIRATQVALNIVNSVDDAPIRATQVALSLIYLPFQPTRVSQIPIHIVYLLPPERDGGVPVGEPKQLIPEWPIEETWEWKTTVFKTYSGREQRMSLRTEPRVMFKYDLPTLTEDQRRLWLYQLHRFGANLFYFPMWQYYTSITGTRSQGATTIDVNTSLSNFRVGEVAAIFSEDLSTFETVTISAINANSVDISDELGLPVAVNSDMFICPAPAGRFKDAQQLAMSRYFGRTNLMINVEPDYAVLRPGQSTGNFSSLDGFTILDDPYLVRPPVGEQVVYNPKVFDTDLNAPDVQRNWHQPQVMHQRRYVIDAANMDYWREFASIIKGGRVPFLLPSYRNDMTLNATPSLGTTQFTTDTNSIYDWMTDFGHRYLEIETANGIIYRKVNDAFLNGDNTVTINLASAIGSSSGDNVISRIGLMPKVRLSGDKIMFKHYKNHTEVAFTAATVRD